MSGKYQENQDLVAKCRLVRQGSRLVAHLNILSHAQVVALLAGPLTPDEGGDGAEQAHQQLHADDQPDLEVQEAVI